MALSFPPLAKVIEHFTIAFMDIAHFFGTLASQCIIILAEWLVNLITLPMLMVHAFLEGDKSRVLDYLYQDLLPVLIPLLFAALTLEWSARVSTPPPEKAPSTLALGEMTAKFLKEKGKRRRAEKELSLLKSEPESVWVSA